MRRSIFFPAVLTIAAACLLASAATAQKKVEKAATIPRELLEERRDAAREVFQQGLRQLQDGQLLPGALSEWSQRWLDAELALTDAREWRAAALEAHLERSKQVEEIAATFAKTGQGRQADAEAARYFRSDAEIRLREAKGR